MGAALLTLVPVGLVLGLLTFGSYGRRRAVPPTPGRVVPVALMAIVLGPVAVTALGLLTWLIGLLLVLAVVLIVALWRPPPPRTLHN